MTDKILTNRQAIGVLDGLWSNPLFGEAHRQAFEIGIKAIKALEQDSKWIPVSEKLPDKEGYYLCSVRYMYPPYNFFEPEKVKYMDDVTIQKFDGEFNIEVKAWMPLPPCYKPQEREVKE